MTKTVFVTGGSGYAGSHRCKAFAEAGWNVVVYDNLSRGWRDFVRWGPLVEGDILDAPTLAAAMRAAKPDAVAHFAALAYVGETMTEPGDYYCVNSMGALNVLDAMRASAVGWTPKRSAIAEIIAGAWRWNTADANHHAFDEKTQINPSQALAL